MPTADTATVDTVLESRSINQPLVFQCYQRLRRAIQDWQSADGFLVADGHGGTVKSFSFELQEAIERFFDDTADDGRVVAPTAREAILRIDDFYGAYVTFKRQASEGSSLASPGGPPEFWKALQNVEAVFASRPAIQLPDPIADLIGLGVSIQQICDIYGWVEEDGRPQIAKVAEERRQPGKHYDPQTWVSPAIAKRQKGVDQEWSNRRATRQAVFLFAEKTSSPTDILKPTIDELVAAGAPPAQISAITGISESQAKDMLAKAGKNDKGEILHPVNSTIAHFENIKKEDARAAKKQAGDASPASVPSGGKDLLSNI